MGRWRALILLLLAGCQRPQLVVTVRSDLLLPGSESPSLSQALVIDRVRVRGMGESNQWPLFDAHALPLSFGAAPDAAGRVELEVTGFDARWMSGEDPIPGTAVTRKLSQSVTSFREVALFLDGDCLGRTCDGAGEPSSTLWGPLAEVACGDAAPEGMVCIPGGASIVGDPDLAEVDPVSDLVAAGPRMAVLAPFFLDRLEVTVARLRPLVTAGTIPAPPESNADPDCNYSRLGSASEEEAVRCVPFATARAACRAWGGDLPTAAQWEHAARGRGRETRYPWGDSPPSCGSAGLGDSPVCRVHRKVGSYPMDASRDGVLDLAGSVREWVLDAPVGFDDCLPAGVLDDPLCESGDLGSLKGGSRESSFEGALLAPRRRDVGSRDLGFRCVH